MFGATTPPAPSTPSDVIELEDDQAVEPEIDETTAEPPYPTSPNPSTPSVPDEPKPSPKSSKPHKSK